MVDDTDRKHIVRAQVRTAALRRDVQTGDAVAVFGQVVLHRHIADDGSTATACPAPASSIIATIRPVPLPISATRWPTNHRRTEAAQRCLLVAPPIRKSLRCRCSGSTARQSHRSSARVRCAAGWGDGRALGLGLCERHSADTPNGTRSCGASFTSTENTASNTRLRSGVLSLFSLRNGSRSPRIACRVSHIDGNSRKLK